MLTESTNDDCAHLRSETHATSSRPRRLPSACGFQPMMMILIMMTAVFCCLHAEGRLARVCAAAHRAHAPARAAAPPTHARRGLNGCKGTTKRRKNAMFSTGHHSYRVDSRGAEVDRTPAPPAARDRRARRAPPDPPRLLAPAAPCRSPCASSGHSGSSTVYSGSSEVCVVNSFFFFRSRCSK